MGYVRKTKDRWDIETNYGYGWEVECSEYTLKEAKEQIKCYRDNVDKYGRGQSRLVKRKERVS